MKLIIKNGTIINPVHHQHEKGDVVIEDGKIVSLGGIADVPGAEVYDAEGFFVTPGLIDMHVRACCGSSAGRTWACGSAALSSGTICPRKRPPCWWLRQTGTAGSTITTIPGNSGVTAPAMT